MHTYPIPYTPETKWTLVGTLRPTSFYCLDCEPDTENIFVTKVYLYRFRIFSQSCKGCGQLIAQGRSPRELYY